MKKLSGDPFPRLSGYTTIIGEYVYRVVFFVEIIFGQRIVFLWWSFCSMLYNKLKNLTVNVDRLLYLGVVG